MRTIKTYAAWTGSLSEYLQIEDLVDEEMVQHFINVLPPATYNYSCIQIGSAHNHIDGKAVFPTLKRTEEGWVFAGHCFRGETDERY